MGVHDWKRLYMNDVGRRVHLRPSEPINEDFTQGVGHKESCLKYSLVAVLLELTGADGRLSVEGEG